MKALVLALLAACGPAHKPLRDVEIPPKPPGGDKPVVVRSETTWDKLDGAIASTEVVGPAAGDADVRTQISDLLRAEVGHPLERPRLRDVLGSITKIRGVGAIVVRGEQLANGGIKLVLDVGLQPTVHALAMTIDGGAPDPITSEPAGKRLDPAHLDELAALVRTRYRDQGHREVVVSWKAVPAGPDAVDVTIDAVPGPLLEVGAIDVTGAKGVRRDELVKLVGKHVVVGQPVRDEAIGKAVDALVALYWDRGYAMVKVDPPVLPTSGKAKIAFVVHEGDLYRVGKVKVTGVPDADAFAKLIGVKQGEVFDRGAIVAARDRVIAELKKRGHVNPLVSPLTGVDDKKHVIDLTFELEPGPK